jgi:phosphoglycolate phosphatase-like HAD superfamily hydrolase
MTMSLKTIKAIIYDLDGTLANSIPVHRAAHKKAFLAFGVKVTDAQLEKLNGMTTEETAARIFKSQDLKKIAAYAKLRSKFATKNFHRIKLFSQVAFTLGLLQKKVPVWICTSSKKKYVLRMYAIMPFLKRFSRSIVTSDGFKKGKPDPALLIATCKKIGIQPHQALYIGDAANDYLCAKAAGCSFVYFLRSGLHWDTRVPKTIPRIKHHKELLELLPATFRPKQ